VDCDVLEADGGTRVAAITGGWVAVADALRFLREEGVPFASEPLTCGVAAVSAGVVDGVPLLDLAYDEDARAQVDMNVVMNSRGEFIEVQGTAESRAFPKATLDALLDLAARGIRRLLELQQDALAR
jgi:ribonuclease PH